MLSNLEKVQSLHDRLKDEVSSISGSEVFIEVFRRRFCAGCGGGYLGETRV